MSVQSAQNGSEVVHQPVPEKPYGEPTITVNEQIKLELSENLTIATL